MKDMGEANYVLGVKIIRDRATKLLGLTQETYIKKTLERYHMQDSKPMDTNVDKSLSLSLNICPKTLEEKEKMFKVLYTSVINSLIYAMMCTRLDICYVIGLVSRYQSNPG
jgi:ATP-binding cassette subfamily B (MDR/TAP) protein 1